VASSAGPDFDIVETRDLSRFYGRRKALANVTLSFKGGELVALFGPNGAGKSTFLGVLSTLLRPSAGDVTYGGRTAQQLGDAARTRIGLLGHELFLYGDLTARENLEFFGRLHAVTDLDARVGDALAAARLEGRGGDRVASFSRGLRQRLALERALLHAPRLLLLDEPFTGLDDESAELLVARLRQLGGRGTIVLIATHDFDSADGLVTRGVCFRNGRTRDLAAGSGTLRARYRATLQEDWR
jgi:heme exporter protein A